MNDFERICGMLARGGVYYNIAGSTPAEVFSDLSKQVSLPEDLLPEAFFNGLCEREKLMTTAIGNGIALPHPRTPMVTEVESECVFVCYLDKPVNFNAMDGKTVSLLFVILSASSESHLKTLSFLSFLLQQESFRAILRKKPDTKELISAINLHL